MLPLLDPDATAAAAGPVGIPERLQGVNLLRAALHHPPVARVIADAIDALVLSGALDPRLREIAILRVGWRIGASYEWGNHYVLARRVGLTDEEIRAVRADDVGSLPPPERCAARVVDDVLDGVSVSAATLAEARELLRDDRALIELVMIPACYRAIGTFLLTFGVPLEEGLEPWPPDGEPPARP